MTTDTLPKTSLASVINIQKAAHVLRGIIPETPLMTNINLSDRYQAHIYLKREDLQPVRSYKIRGAYYKISGLPQEDLQKGVVCASAGNHAQGLAYACYRLKVRGVIFMPHPTPKQKVSQVRMFGKEFVEVRLTGDTFDDAYRESVKYCQAEKMTFIHPFDDPRVIEGQATVGLEIYSQMTEEIDYIILPVGGGGLSAGVGSYFKQISPKTKIIGVEPSGAAAMKISLEKGEIVTLENIDKFVDGAAVQRVGNLTFDICRQILDEVIAVPEGKVCSTILSLYNEEAIVVEPAGALSIAALDFLKDRPDFQGKNVVCVISGSNNDITRMEDIKERSLLYEGLKHYFIISFPQRAGALREFLVNILGENDDITCFEYMKKNNREMGPALVGLEVPSRQDYEKLLERLKGSPFQYEHLNQHPDLFGFIV